MEKEVVRGPDSCCRTVSHQVEFSSLDVPMGNDDILAASGCSAFAWNICPAREPPTEDQSVMALVAPLA